MKYRPTIPQIVKLFALSTTCLVTSSFQMIYAAQILPTQANINAQLNAGIRFDADFDWGATNILNNPNYFESHNNFFNDFRRGKGIVYDESTHGFLNAKKAVIVADQKGKKNLSPTYQTLDSKDITHLVLLSHTTCKAVTRLLEWVLGLETALKNSKLEVVLLLIA